MSFTINEIAPQDIYIVKVTKIINNNHFLYMTELYQPIIGSEATSFYYTLLNHVPMGKAGVSDVNLHRKLIGQMQLSFHSIIKARKMLEAVGLLKSKKYKHKDREEYIYEYTILTPLHPMQFFQSDILSVLLLNRIGKTYFQQSKNQLIPTFDWNNGEYIYDKEITKSFDEVFDSVLASELQIAPGSELEQIIQPYNIQSENESNQKINIKQQYLDIEFIKGMVSNLFQVNNSLDQKMIELLQELAFLYQLSELDVINLLNDHTVYNHEEKLDEKLIRKRIREKYQYEQKDVLIVKKEELNTFDHKKLPNIEDKAKRHQWILDNFSPFQLMQQYQNGGKIPDADLAIIDGLIHDYKLPSSVVNVLIEYVMLSNDKKLPRNLAGKIAGHWKRLNIKTVEEAQELAKKEHQLYKQWQDGSQKPNKNSTTNKRTKPVRNQRKEKIPDYIVNQEKKDHQNEDKEEISEIDKAKINQLLKDLGEI